MNIIDINKRFGTREKCIKYMEKLRWDGVPKCPYCESDNTVSIEKGFRHHCNSCKRSFSVLVGTIFENSRLPLNKWFVVIFLMLNAKKGMSAKEISRISGINYKGAWYTAMKIRCAMITKEVSLTGVLEMDEAYIPAYGDDNSPKTTVSNLSKHDSKKKNRRNAIIGIVERGGNVVPELVHSTHARVLMDFLKKNIKSNESILITDGNPAYKQMDDFIEHLVIMHKKHFSEGFTNINTIEGFWSLIKSGLKGNFQAVSKKYLPFYLVEFQYKFNLRNSIQNEMERFIKNALTVEYCMINYKPIKKVKEIVYGK